MGSKDFFKLGDYNVICDTSGQKFKASECRLQWDGLLVGGKNFDTRHPQDFVRSTTDDQTVPIARLRQPIKFIDTVDPDDL